MSELNGQAGYGRRYKVVSLSGVPIRPTNPSNQGRVGIEWYILDRFHCYDICARFKGRNSEAKARALALEWNIEERAWEKAG